MVNSVPHPASRIWLRIRILATFSGSVVKLYVLYRTYFTGFS
jgi:hypothetical protein